MSKLPNARKIVSEDFDKEAKRLIDKLAFILNKFMQDTVSTVNGNLDFDNLDQEKVTFEMTVDGSGIPVGNDIIRVVKPNVSGIQCIRAVNTVAVTNYPTATPFVNFDYSTTNLLRVKKITGLVANEKYLLTLILY